MATFDPGMPRPYQTLPKCVDGQGHKFSVGPSRIPVCERCGLTRTPVTFPDQFPYYPLRPLPPYYGNLFHVTCDRLTG